MIACAWCRALFLDAYLAGGLRTQCPAAHNASHECGRGRLPSVFAPKNRFPAYARAAQAERAVRHSAIYSDDCEWINYTASPATKRVKPVYFIHSMGGVSCQVLYQSDVIAKVYNDRNVAILTAGRDTAGNSSLPYHQRQTAEAIAGRAKTIASDLHRLASLPHADDILVFGQSHGMYQFIDSYSSFLYKDQWLVKRLQLRWNPMFTDWVTTKESGTLGRLVDMGLLRVIPNEIDPITHDAEYYIPCSLPFAARAADAFRIHFRGKRVVRDGPNSYHVEPYVYKAEEIGFSFEVGGTCMSTLYDLSHYHRMILDTLASFRSLGTKLPVPICALAGLSDGLWNATNETVDALLKRYFSSNIKFMLKDTWHLWLTNNLLLEEWLNWCDAPGWPAYDASEIYGEFGEPW